jgi:hypothetical protein
MSFSQSRKLAIARIIPFGTWGNFIVCPGVVKRVGREMRSLVFLLQTDFFEVRKHRGSLVLGVTRRSLVRGIK